MEEVNALNKQFINYSSFNSWLMLRRYQHLSKYFSGKTVLEVGVGDGIGTGVLLQKFNRVTVVDGSSSALDNIANKFPKVIRHHSLFEEMEFEEKFDTVILAHVLEHVDNPTELLEKVLSFTSPGGTLIVDVPNADSLHRQMGVELGLLKTRDELNQTDISLGHKRVYSFLSFIDEILNLNVSTYNLHFGGMFVKIFDEKYTEKIFNRNQLEAMFKLGMDNPEIAADIYAVVRNTQ